MVFTRKVSDGFEFVTIGVRNLVSVQAAAKVPINIKLIFHLISCYYIRYVCNIRKGSFAHS